jgi:hypothetical protein
MREEETLILSPFVSFAGAQTVDLKHAPSLGVCNTIVSKFAEDQTEYAGLGFSNLPVTQRTAELTVLPAC